MRWTGLAALAALALLASSRRGLSPSGASPARRPAVEALLPTANVAPPPALRHPNIFAASTGGTPGEFVVHPIAGHVEDREVSVLAPGFALAPHPHGYRPAMDGAAHTFASGSPDLPKVSRLLPGVPGRAARVEIIATSFRDIPGVDIAPVPTRDLEYDLDGSSDVVTSLDPDDGMYGADAFWPPDLAEVSEAWQGTNKVTRLSFLPLQYNPVTRTLRYHESISARLVYAPEEEYTIPGARFAAQSAAPLPDPFACPPLYSDPVLPPMTGQPGDFAVRRAGAEVDAIYRITTSKEGIHRITRDELTAPGVGIPPADLVGSRIRMYSRDAEIAIYVSTPGQFGPSDYILFYAETYTGWYSLDNVYWLGLGGTGARMTQVALPPLGGANEVTRHYQLRTYAPNTTNTVNVAPLNEDWDHWRAAQLLTNQGVEIFALNDSFPTAFPVPGDTVKLCATLHGVAENAAFEGEGHNTVVDINGTTVSGGQFQWSGTGSFGGAPFSGSVTFSSSILTSPITSFFVRQVLLPGNTAGDQVYLEALHLIYPRELRAANNRLIFAGETGANNYTVDAFPATSGLWAFDVSDPAAVERITGFTTQGTANGFSLRFGHDTTENRRYWVSRDAGFRSVTSMAKTPIRDLGNPLNQADYIIVCPASFRTQVYRLLTHRFLNGERVFVAQPEDVYNVFSYGIKDANALRQFLGYAFHHWAGPPPRHCVLVGDGSVDPNGYVSSAEADIIPALMGGTPFRYTALDVRNGMVNGTNGSGEADTLADILVGRIPVRSNTELQAVVDKILAYEALPGSDPFRTRALLVTGAETTVPPLDFVGTATDIETNLLANGFSAGAINKQYWGQGASNAGVLNAINLGDGRFIAAYLGHGAHYFWNFPFLLSTGDAGNLTNTRWPIFTAITCVNGYYIEPNAGDECLAEVLLELPNHGGIAAIAGTALSQDAAASAISVGFHDALVAQKVRTLGEAMAGGYLRAFRMGFDTSLELTFYQIFGDPGLVVNP